jgi:hypothetical protein
MSQNINSHNPSKVPIAILIFSENGQYVYRAYSPHEYRCLPDGSDPDHTDEQFGQFIANIYNHIAYNDRNPISNQTNYGRLLEIHTRHIEFPVDQRENRIWFSTYNHPYCNYRPVHRQSPIFFDVNSAINYQQQQQQLRHTSATHQLI